MVRMVARGCQDVPFPTPRIKPLALCSPFSSLMSFLCIRASRSCNSDRACAALSDRRFGSISQGNLVVANFRSVNLSPAPPKLLSRFLPQAKNIIGVDESGNTRHAALGQPLSSGSSSFLGGFAPLERGWEIVSIISRSGVSF